MANDTVLAVEVNVELGFILYLLVTVSGDVAFDSDEMLRGVLPVFVELGATFG